MQYFITWVENMRKLILYGDSNTYGYNPRGFMGGRYPAESRWADLVAKELEGKYQVIAEGMNGRQLPSVHDSFFTELIASLEADDVMVMMLGTNDILLTNRPDANLAIRKMNVILSYVKKKCKGRFIVIAPVPISASSEELATYNRENLKMNKAFIEMATSYDIETFDAGNWNIELAYDSVHFSENGHKEFAKAFLEKSSL